MTSKKDNDSFKKVRTSRTFANILATFDLNKKSVLDVGCSEGHYLQCFGEGSQGVTIIKEHADEANERGLDVVLKNVEDPEFSMDKKFDVVWANNIFEHMNSPHPFLMNMREQLAEDGVLILGVPVVPHIPLITRIKKFRGAYAVSHVNFFTRRTLIDTVRFAGFDVTTARSFHLNNPALDFFLNLIAPHIYIVATPKQNFTYPHKRLRSLEGY